MEVSQTENFPPPPGIINSIKAGFDAIASHITAIFLPLALNLFMWLGPRLHIDELFKTFWTAAVPIWRSSGIPAEDIQRMFDWSQQQVPLVNLFWLIRTLPIGISSLLLPKGALSTPLGDPAILQVTALNFPGWVFLLTLVGWVGGGLYYRSVAGVIVSQDEQQIRPFPAVVRSVMISFAVNFLLMLLAFPLMFILFIAVQVSAVLANLFVLFLSLASMWVIVPVFFWPLGVFVKRQNVLTSILSSIQLTRFTLPTSSLFILVVFLLSYGLNFLWSIPAEDSWMTLIGIFGHSFVSTALLASSFIYYRDMSAWLQTVLEKLRPNGFVKQA